MVLNLLQQADVNARIDGEYLQGGAGDLQAIGVIRVMVDEKDYLEARDIVDEWDKQQPAQEPTSNPPKTNSRITSSIIGFMCGIAAMAFYYHTPITEDGIDNNSDGALDEKWTYVNGLLSKTEVDQNFDGDIDFIMHFDRQGLVYSSSSDDDFNGTFETTMTYLDGNLVQRLTDTTGDGFNNHKIMYTFGVAETGIYLDPLSKKPVKIQYFSAFKLERAKVDTNGDGKLDSTYEYDAIEERIEKPE
jgi:hypothetical protein